MKIKNLKFTTLSVILFFFLHYQTASAKTFAELVDELVGFLSSSAVTLVFALAFVYFFYGVAQYVLFPDGESKDKGRQMMLWGVIALTVMFSVYGLIRLVTATFGL